MTDAPIKVHLVENFPLEHNGKLLAGYYDAEDRVDQLLDLGNIHSLRKRLYPGPSNPHEPFDKQEDVTVSYSREYGSTDSAATTMTLEELDRDAVAMGCVFVFTEDRKWMYFHQGQSLEGMHDPKATLDRLGINYQPDEKQTDAPSVTPTRTTQNPKTSAWFQCNKIYDMRGL